MSKGVKNTMADAKKNPGKNSKVAAAKKKAGK